MTKHRKFTSRKKVLPGFLLLMSVFISCLQGSAEKAKGNAPSAHEENGIGADSAYVVDIRAMDYAFGMPEEIPSGWVTFRMKNMGKEEHVAVVNKLVDTVNYDRLTGTIVKAVSQGDVTGFEEIEILWEADMGGPGLLSPGRTGETSVFLEPGIYVMSCGVNSPDGKYHWQKGMIRAFKVTDKKTGAGKPEGTVNVTLSDFAISTGNTFGAGPQVFDVKFEGQHHDVHLAKLSVDQDLEDLKTWMNDVKAPSSFEFLGGAEQVPEGMTSTFKATMEPGRYAFVSHGLAASGMAEEFTIPQSGETALIQNEPINPEVMIQSGPGGTDLPEVLATGRTWIVLQNTGSEEYKYHITSLREGYSEEDYRKFIKEVYVDEDYPPEGTVFLDNFIYYGSVRAQDQERFNLAIEEKKYFLIGPLLPGRSWKSQWRENYMIHVFEGLNTNRANK